MFPSLFAILSEVPDPDVVTVDPRVSTMLGKPFPLGPAFPGLLPVIRGGGPRGARGARAPRKTEDLWSKSFENLQNLTFRSNRGPP